jgi:ketosteroid isomerase-like protein
MRKLACLALLGVAAGGVQGAYARNMTGETAAAVRRADQAFEKRAQEVGVAQAFREYMDGTDGLQFNGGPPVRGAAAIYKVMGGDAGRRSVLEWTPVDAWGSRGGDMGVTTGTWVASRNKEHAGPQMKGRYVTVWRKDAHGAWKGLIDIGTPDP